MVSYQNELDDLPRQAPTVQMSKSYVKHVVSRQKTKRGYNEI